jgi:hypothetical protein
MITLLILLNLILIVPTYIVLTKGWHGIADHEWSSFGVATFHAVGGIFGTTLYSAELIWLMVKYLP